MSFSDYVRLSTCAAELRCIRALVSAAVVGLVRGAAAA